MRYEDYATIEAAENNRRAKRTVHFTRDNQNNLEKVCELLGIRRNKIINVAVQKYLEGILNATNKLQ